MVYLNFIQRNKVTEEMIYAFILGQGKEKTKVRDD